MGGKIYYGWFVLAASAVCELLVMGATAYASGLFVLPLQAEFHISRADANSSILILYLGGALGCALPIAAGLIAAGFGASAFGAAMGWTYALMQGYSILTTRFIGFVFDSSHGYLAAFATFLVLSSGVFLASLVLAPRKSLAA